MKPSDVKLGLVYRYRRLGPLYLVVELIGDAGAHVWLNLETGDVGQSTLVELGFAGGANYQIPDFDSGERQ